MLVKEGFPEEVTFEMSFEGHVEGDLVKSGQQGRGHALQSEDALWANAV